MKSAQWGANQPYGLSELELDAADRYSAGGDLVRHDQVRCCIRDCGHWLTRRRQGASDLGAYCPDHQVSVSTSPTYLYKDYRRNFIIDIPGLERVKKLKVESWRLGNERSEDALSWNVFVGLQRLGGLRDVVRQLVALNEEPQLYLWGVRIEPTDEDPRTWEQLEAIRVDLEPRASIPTEPDIMLRVPGRALILVEAKFGSPNGSLARKKGRFGSVAEFVNAYAPRGRYGDPLSSDWIKQQPPDQVLEQLCRNVVFAQRLAENGEVPYVVNLVQEQGELDVEERFRPHLAKDGPVKFQRATWEQLYKLPIMADDEAAPLRRYMKNKTNRLKRAFEI